MIKTLNFCILLALVIGVMSQPRSAHAQCLLPTGYLEAINADFEEYGTAFAEVNIEDPAAVGRFYIDLTAIRQQYEDQTLDLPECALRAHLMILALLSNMQDTMGYALALHADPTNETTYLAQVEASSTRLSVLPPLIETQILLLQRIPPLSVRYIVPEAVNVRAEPGADSETLGTLAQGARIEVIALDLDSRQNVWYKFYFGEGVETGWVLGELTSETPQ